MFDEKELALQRLEAVTIMKVIYKHLLEMKIEHNYDYLHLDQDVCLAGICFTDIHIGLVDRTQTNIPVFTYEDNLAYIHFAILDKNINLQNNKEYLLNLFIKIFEEEYMFVLQNILYYLDCKNSNPKRNGFTITNVPGKYNKNTFKTYLQTYLLSLSEEMSMRNWLRMTECQRNEFYKEVESECIIERQSNVNSKLYKLEDKYFKELLKHTKSLITKKIG